MKFFRRKDIDQWDSWFLLQSCNRILHILRSFSSLTATSNILPNVWAFLFSCVQTYTHTHNTHTLTRIYIHIHAAYIHSYSNICYIHKHTQHIYILELCSLHQESDVFYRFNLRGFVRIPEYFSCRSDPSLICRPNILQSVCFTLRSPPPPHKHTLLAGLLLAIHVWAVDFRLHYYTFLPDSATVGGQTPSF